MKMSKIKTGPLLVIGSLVMLLVIAVVLTPTPEVPEEPPAPPEPPERATTEEQVEQERQLIRNVLEDLKQQLVVANPVVQEEVMREVREVFFEARGVEREELGRFVVDLARNHRSTVVRTAAAEMLVLVDDLDQEVVLRIARHDPEAEVRQAAIRALGKTPPGGEAEQMLRRILNDPDPGMRSAATVALAQMMTRSGTAGARELCSLLGNPDNDASAQASMLLHQRGASSLPALIETVYNSDSGPQRASAANTIAMICAGYNPSLSAFAREAQVTHRQVPEKRQANLTGLQPLIHVLQNDSWPAAREAAAQGLGYLGDERAAAPLAAALKDSDDLVRRRAAAALITVPAKTVAIQIAEAATKDPKEEVRRFAVEALGRIGETPQVVRALETASQDESPEVRRYAALELGRIGGEEATGALINMLGDNWDRDPDVRWAVVRALADLETMAARDVLLKSLRDPSPQVANTAERALQRLGIARMERAGYAN